MMATTSSSPPNGRRPHFPGPGKGTASLWRKVVGVLFMFVAFFSILSGYFLMGVPLKLFLMPLAPKLFRYCFELIVGFWTNLPVAYWEYVAGTKFVFYGEVDKLNQNSITICNHRTYFDWVYLWTLFGRYGRLTNVKVILKNALRYIPVVGWVLQIMRFIFVHRQWDKDRPLIDRALKVFTRTKYPLQLIIFPEGTNLDRNGRNASVKYANKYGLTNYQYVLHPRSKGFVHTVKMLDKAVDAIIDITVAYKYYIPEDRDSLVQGEYADEVHFYVKSYPIESLPKNEADIVEWLKTRWAEKETMLEKFYDGSPSERHRFPDRVDKPVTLAARYVSCALFWFANMAIFSTMAFYFVWFRWYVLAGTVFNVLLERFFMKYDEVEHVFSGKY